MKFDNNFDALIACRNHWQFLMITGSSEKSDYEPSLDWWSRCACCEATPHIDNDEDESKDCSQCPLTGFAWQEGYEGSLCFFSLGSAYRQWVLTSDSPSEEESRKFWAGRMVYACNQAIEAILIKGDEQ